MLKKMMIIAALLVTPQLANAAQDARVLYLGVDQGKNLMARNSQAFNRVFNHTGNYLHHRGLDVLEEAAQSRHKTRSLKEARDIIRQTRRSSYDVAVIVSLRHNQNSKGYRIKDRLIATAQIIDPQTLDVIKTIEEKSPVARLEQGQCGAPCQNMILRRHVREVLPDFKDKLAGYLRDYRPAYVQQAPQADKVTLTLKGFSPREVRHLEDRIVQLDSTRDLSSLTSRPEKRAFWLERKKNADDLNHELGNVLANLDLQARIINTTHHVTLIKVHRDLAWLE